MLVRQRKKSQKYFDLSAFKKNWNHSNLCSTVGAIGKREQREILLLVSLILQVFERGFLQKIPGNEGPINDG